MGVTWSWEWWYNHCRAAEARLGALMPYAALWVCRAFSTRAMPSKWCFFQ